MTIRLPALPALVAARALRNDAAQAARRSLDQIKQLLGCYDLALSLVHDMPPAARDAMVAALRSRLVATEQRARACQERLDEAQAFCASLRHTPSPTTLVEVPGGLFEMLSPYLDDAMAPVLDRISRRAGSGCTAEDVGLYFRPALAT